MSRILKLPGNDGSLSSYTVSGQSLPVFRAVNHTPTSSRLLLSACHVVADPLSANEPSVAATIDWSATLAYRRYLHSLGLGIAEAMDTAQRGMGLDWPMALELIKHTRAELPDAVVFNGCGTDQLERLQAKTLADVERAYAEQLEAVQSLDARVVLMASRALAKVANSPDDYHAVYTNILSICDKPVILHWLGEMFDPQLAGYWGSTNRETAMNTCLAIISDNASKIDGIKISLLDKNIEIRMRRLLPESVRMYTGDDFNYPQLIAGDEQGFSHALLGIFDPLAPLAAHAGRLLDAGDKAGFHDLLDPTVPLARHVFKAPTHCYKTGVVFLAWLNGHQDHFVMVSGAQSQRSLPHLSELFQLADQCGLLSDPDVASQRLITLLKLYGVEQ